MSPVDDSDDAGYGDEEVTIEVTARGFVKVSKALLAAMHVENPQLRLDYLLEQESSVWWSDFADGVDSFDVWFPGGSPFPAEQVKS